MDLEISGRTALVLGGGGGLGGAMKAEREGRSLEEVRAESTSSIPVGRYGEPQEYGDVVAFFASRRAAYITGSMVRVDGGLIPSI